MSIRFRLPAVAHGHQRTFSTTYVCSKRFNHPPGGERPDLPTAAQKEKRVQFSKTISWLLRHAAEQKGLPIRSDGYVKVRDLLKATELRGLDFLGLEKIVGLDTKNRFNLSYEPHAGPPSSPQLDHWWIRANQGHSMTNVSELELRRLTSPEEVPMAVHGTSVEAWKQISVQGLSKKGRNHIHLAPGVASGGVISGMRKGSRILIYIDMAKAMADGIKFYLSTNQVILTAGEHGYLKPEYFRRVEILKKTYQPIPGWEGTASTEDKVENFVEDTFEDTKRDATHPVESGPSLEVEPATTTASETTRPKVRDHITLL
ncbi:tRNA 2'-phosphotransferase [Marasmius crinis-equi]|uniref:2'-phosphotransferase n=1 Tax=Marasmius crinis-equi TaxID=585013 RepID=A0ABR3FA84_9AGAR